MKHGATNSFKFKKLVRRLRPIVSGAPIDVETIVVGLLEKLWHTAISNAPEGDIGKLEDDDIASMVGWQGEPELLVDALVECGWLDRSEEHRLVIHDWHEHAPNHVKGNLRRWQKQFANLSEDSPQSDSTKQAPKEPTRDFAKQPPMEAPKQHPMELTTIPNHTIPNQTYMNSSNEEFLPGAADAATGPEAVVVMAFPVVGGKEREWSLTDAKVAEYQESYPGVDIIAECRKARQWVIDNPGRRKTPKGMPAFLNTWLSKTQNQGGTRNGPTQRTFEHRNADRRLGSGQFFDPSADTSGFNP